jgi:non-homologous end joining protein Ku
MGVERAFADIVPRICWGIARMVRVAIGLMLLVLAPSPAHLHNAAESKSEISFRQIHKPSGRRVNYEKVVQGSGKIENADIVNAKEIDYRYFERPYFLVPGDEMAFVMLCARPERSGLRS